MLKKVETGIIFRNPSPQLKSIHAYFPSVVVTDNCDMLATVVLGEAFEAVNMHTYLFRSNDYGKHWINEGPLYLTKNDQLISDYSRIARLPNGELIVLMLCANRSDHLNEGLTNPETLGFVSTEFITMRSEDQGRSWTEPKIIKSVLGKTPLELCCPVTPLSDGKCLLPTSTWGNWDGSIPLGYRTVALVSHDLGKNWQEYIDVMIDPKQEIRYWESKIIELPDHILLGVAWAYNQAQKKDLPNQYVISRDGGKSWSTPKSTGLIGQTLTPFLLEDGHILSIYRRMDRPGLWANISRMEKKLWINEHSEPLWGNNAASLAGDDGSMARIFRALKFGAPCITRLPDRSIFISFWAVEDCISVIRWFKLIEE